VGFTEVPLNKVESENLSLAAAAEGPRGAAPPCPAPERDTGRQLPSRAVLSVLTGLPEVGGAVQWFRTGLDLSGRGILKLLLQLTRIQYGL